MKISVVVPLYNTRSYIAEAIDSILSQSRPADEILVIDDGSTDRGGEIVKAYGSPVRLLVQTHAGSSTALNLGLRHAAGDAIAFLDADDVWVPNKLERQAVALDADESLDGVMGHVQQFPASASWQDCRALSAPQAGVSRITLLARRRVFDKYGMFDTAYNAVDFVPWYSRAVALGIKTVILPEVVAYRRLHAANTGIVRRAEQQRENLLGLKQALDVRRRPGTAK